MSVAIYAVPALGIAIVAVVYLMRGDR